LALTKKEITEMKSKLLYVGTALLLTTLVLSVVQANYGNFRAGPWGMPIQPMVLATPEVGWTEIDTITATQATLAVGARDGTSVDGLAATKTIVWDVPEVTSGWELRFQTTANADAHVVEVWVAAADSYDSTLAGSSQVDHYTLGAILTLTGGQQVGPHSNVFVDTIARTASTGILTGSEVVDSGADRIAIWRLDLRGYKRVVMIATTLQGSSTLYAEARWY
jgi:hypothetical protein